MLDLTEDETAALVAHPKHAVEYDPLPVRTAARPAEVDPGEAGTSGRALAAVEARHGAEPGSREVATVITEMVGELSLTYWTGGNN